MSSNHCAKIALIQPEVIDSWESGETGRIGSLVSHSGCCNNFTIVANPSDADVIILIESAHYPNRTLADIQYYNAFLNSEYCDERKLLVINYEDSPTGALPGLYTSLERSKFNNALHLSWPHMRLFNEFVEKEQKCLERDGTFLFSFSGSCSNPI